MRIRAANLPPHSQFADFQHVTSVCVLHCYQFCGAKLQNIFDMCKYVRHFFNPLSSASPVPPFNGGHHGAKLQIIFDMCK